MRLSAHEKQEIIHLVEHSDLGREPGGDGELGENSRGESVQGRDGCQVELDEGAPAMVVLVLGQIIGELTSLLALGRLIRRMHGSRDSPR